MITIWKNKNLVLQYDDPKRNMNGYPFLQVDLYTIDDSGKEIRILREWPETRKKAFEFCQKIMNSEIANTVENKVEKSQVDSKGYYTGYCQCSCKSCQDGKQHCQGLICRGD